jgi:hypothetical protein
MRRDYNSLAFHGDLNLGIWFEVGLPEHRSVENDPARGADARQSLHEWHLDTTSDGNNNIMITL